ncbi:MAG: Hsp33 family molecular chaperone HslO [Janthinobacterium lividum]
MVDQLQKFIFDAAPVRGEIVSLENTWQEVLTRRAYPAAVQSLLGEMMAAAALLSANLKFDGSLIMQIHGDGPVQMLVVQCDSALSMRATAKLADRDVPIAADATLSQLLNPHGGARFAITLDPRERGPGAQPYQGVVSLEDDNGPIESMAKVLEHYMQHSEQLDTRIWLAADEKHAVGMLLQKLPRDGGIMPHRGDADADTWDRVGHLASTLTASEMLAADADTLLRRLFWQENVRRFEPLRARFQCTCSRAKVGAMLQMLGSSETDEILNEQGRIEIHCEFCNQRYAFDPVDVAQLFAGDGSALPPSARIAPPGVQRH